jgi:hypothetical protein
VSTFEYRKLLRANVLLRVLYKAKTAPSLEGIAYTKNVGTIGINMICAHQIERNTGLDLEIFLPQEEKPVIAKGRLIWQYKCSYIPDSKKQYYVCGIQFEDMSPDDAVKTSEFIRHLLQEKSTEEIKKIIEMIEGKEK